MSRIPRAFRARLNLLPFQHRTLPAGNVTATLSTAGDLRIVGDNSENTIAVEYSQSQIKIIGIDTTINGPATSATIPLTKELRNVVIDMRKAGTMGADRVSVSDLVATGAFTLKGVHAGAVTVTDVVVHGHASIKFADGVTDPGTGAGSVVNVVNSQFGLPPNSTKRGNLSITTGRTPSAVEIVDSDIGGRLSIRGNRGSDSATVRDTSVGGNTTISLSDGANRIAVVGELSGNSLGNFSSTTDIGGVLSVTGTGGVDAAAFMGTLVRKDLKASLGNGNNFIGSKDLVVLGRLRITTGIGADTIAIGSMMEDESIGFVQDSVDIATSRGTDLVAIRKLQVLESVKVSTSGDMDQVEIADSVLGADLSANGGKLAEQNLGSFATAGVIGKKTITGFQDEVDADFRHEVIELSETHFNDLLNGSSSALKITVQSDRSEFDTAGQIVNYTYSVENTRAATYTSVTVEADMSLTPQRQSDAPGDGDNLLEPGETWVYKASYTVTAIDVESGDDLVHSATVESNETGPTSAESSILNTYLPGELTAGVVIHPVEHASLVMKWNGIVIYVDPVGGAAPFTGLPRADLVLITHGHGDHFNVLTIAAVLKPNGKLVAPQSVYNLLPHAMKDNCTVLANNQDGDLLGLNVEAVPAYNANHGQGLGNGYILNIPFAGDMTRIYISGDTGPVPEVRAIDNIDIAFVSMSVPFTMSVADAASVVRDIQPAVVYPYHYRNQDGSFADLDEFQDLVGTDLGIEVRIRDWYA